MERVGRMREEERSQKRRIIELNIATDKWDAECILEFSIPGPGMGYLFIDSHFYWIRVVLQRY